ncbi:MAG: hypothetical protein WD052_13465, partial [Bacteroidales bacterium]
VNRSGNYLMQIGDYSEVKGSPYLDETFKKGAIKLDGEWYRETDLRYDSFDGVFEVKLKDGIFVIRPENADTDSILYNKEIFVTRDMNPEKPVRMQYMVSLYQDESYTLLKRYSARLDNAVKTDGYSEAKPAEYKPNPPVYYIFRGQEPLEVKGTGSIADIFAIDRKSVKRYMRQHKYNSKNELDLIEIIRHFSSINK